MPRLKLDCENLLSDTSMDNKRIIFVPGKNPKPREDQHRALLWRALMEGVRRAEPEIARQLEGYADNFSVIPWNFLYYHEYKDISIDLPWIDALINQHGPTEQDVREAESLHVKLDRALLTLADIFHFLIPLLPEVVRNTAKEINRYFGNHDNIACEIRELLKKELRPLLSNNDKIMLIGHSLGSVIAYDTLWELCHLEKLPGKVDVFLTIGSPLGMNYVQRRLKGTQDHGKKHFPTNIKKWVNISSVGDAAALDRVFLDDFCPMLKLGIIESIEDHCQGIYNFFRNAEGLNVHRSYGYLVNPAVGKIIADWWQA
ncbi:MAG: lipase family protein [Gammaproteobacteria bacterium]|nr:lipase family protein [Gammaproteobacteria bacterium]